MSAPVIRIEVYYPHRWCCGSNQPFYKIMRRIEWIYRWFGCELWMKILEAHYLELPWYETVEAAEAVIEQELGIQNVLFHPTSL